MVGFRILTVALVAGLLGPPAAHSAEAELSVTFVAVGAGDAAVYRGPCGELALVDANRRRHDEVLAVLDTYGSRELQWINASHYHRDHIGGLEAVATAPGASVGTVYDRGGGADAYEGSAYPDYHDWVTSPGVDRQTVAIGDVLTLCSGDQQVRFEVLSVGRDGRAAGGVAVSNENDHSVCLKVTYRTFSLATCGDAGGTDSGGRADIESVVAEQYGPVDVVRVNHHGAGSSSNETYVSTLQPAVAVISVGATSTLRPDVEVVERWQAAGAAVYQTQRGGSAEEEEEEEGDEPVHGDITVTTSGDGAFMVTTSTGLDERVFGTPEPPPAEDPEPTSGCPEERVPPARFTDIAGNPHERAIDCVSWWGITGGIDGDRYGPALAVRRDQMAAFVARTILVSGGDLPPASAHPGFSDTRGNVHEESIRRLAAAGLVEGHADGRYDPASAVRRDQMASFLVRAYEQRSGEALEASGDHFTDTAHSVHRESINKAAEAGFAEGTSATTYEPEREVGRDQMASFLTRVLDRLVERGHATPPS